LSCREANAKLVERAGEAEMGLSDANTSRPTYLIYSGFEDLLIGMNIYDLTVDQFKRAAAIKEQINDLNKELRAILGPSARSRPGRKRKRTLSAAAKRKIATAQKARWANLRRAKPARQQAKTAAKAR
jgi:hypothetical protein